MRPVTERDVLDCLALSDALVEAGWAKGTIGAGYGWEEGLWYTRHCALGAVLTAAEELSRKGELLRERLVVEVVKKLAQLIIDAGIVNDWQEAPAGIVRNDFWRNVVVIFNDRQKDAEPVRSLFHVAAAQLGKG